MSVTTSEHTNLVSAILAKKMGAKRTIARVENPEFMDPEQLKVFHELGVDIMISPNYLVANEIKLLLKQTALTDIFEFEDGKLSLIGITVSERSFMAGKNILHIAELVAGLTFRPIAILRGETKILPPGATIVRAREHISLVAKKDGIVKEWAV